MGINWDEINEIIQERSSERSYMVRPEEMTAGELAKISFLIAEVNCFVDNQSTVAASGALLREHLASKYPELSFDSIGRLVSRFCFLNK